MIGYNDQRRNLRAARFSQCDATCTTDCGHCKGNGPAATPEPALIVLDVNDPRVLAVLGRDEDSPATKLAALQGIGDPAEHTHNSYWPGGVTRHYTVEEIDGGAA